MHVFYAHDESWTLRIEQLTPSLHDGPGAELQGTVDVFYAPEARVTSVPLSELRGLDENGDCEECGRGSNCRHLQRNGNPYRRRGWCRAEALWSLARALAFKSIAIPFRTGRNGTAPLAPEEFEAKTKLGELRFTRRSDLDIVVKLQAKVFQKKAAEATVLCLTYLPAAEVEVLCRALHHYMRLEDLEVSFSELGGATGEAWGSLPCPRSPILSTECPGARPSLVLISWNCCQVLARALPSGLRQLKLENSSLGDVEAEAGRGKGGSKVEASAISVCKD